jgi:hypothetical protein
MIKRVIQEIIVPGPPDLSPAATPLNRRSEKETLNSITDG